jgi:hypothetical protein
MPVRRFAVLLRFFPLFFAVIARCFLLLFRRCDCKNPRNSAAFADRAAVFSWKNSEKQRRLAAVAVLP